jgi:adenylate cyclase class 2
MSDREVEIKVRVENSSNLLDFLVQNAQFQKESHQIDIYYTAPHRDFLSVRPVKEWLRLRDSNGRYSINYKNWQYEADGKSNYCDEYETPVESLEQLQKILNALNFKPITTVDKLRKTWLYKDYEIAVDSVKDLGNFVEIEYKGEGTIQAPAQITAEMIDFLKGLNVGKIERDYVGYPFMLLFGSEVEQIAQ